MVVADEGSGLFPGGVAPARPPRGHEQACSTGSDHYAYRQADGELAQRVDQWCLAPGRAAAGHGAGQEEQHQRGRQTVVETAFNVDDLAQLARDALTMITGEASAASVAANAAASSATIQTRAPGSRT